MSAQPHHLSYARTPKEVPQDIALLWEHTMRALTPGSGERWPGHDWAREKVLENGWDCD